MTCISEKNLCKFSNLNCQLQNVMWFTAAQLKSKGLNHCHNRDKTFKVRCILLNSDHLFENWIGHLIRIP